MLQRHLVASWCLITAKMKRSSSCCHDFCCKQTLHSQQYLQMHVAFLKRVDCTAFLLGVCRNKPKTCCFYSVGFHGSALHSSAAPGVRFYGSTSVFTIVAVSLRQPVSTTSDNMADAAQIPAAEEVLMENEESSGAGKSSGAPGATARDKPVCLIVLGMAGSGKTTFVQVN